MTTLLLGAASTYVTWSSGMSPMSPILISRQSNYCIEFVSYLFELSCKLCIKKLFWHRILKALYYPLYYHIYNSLWARLTNDSFFLGAVSIDCSLVALWQDHMMVDVTAQLHNTTTIPPSIDLSRSDPVTTPQGNSLWIQDLNQVTW